MTSTPAKRRPRGARRILDELKAIDDPREYEDELTRLRHDNQQYETEIARLRHENQILRIQSGRSPIWPVEVWVYRVGENDDDEIPPYYIEADARADAETWWKSENPHHENPTFEWKPVGKTHELHAVGRATGITVYAQTLRKAAR